MTIFKGFTISKEDLKWGVLVHYEDRDTYTQTWTNVGAHYVIYKAMMKDDPKQGVLHFIKWKYLTPIVKATR